MTFTVRSNNFKDGDYLPNAHILSAEFGFGCQGNNQSPHLAWSGAPAHRYLFTVFAVGTDRLQVTADTSAAVIGFQLHFNTLAKTEIMGLYKR